MKHARNGVPISYSYVLISLLLVMFNSVNASTLYGVGGLNTTNELTNLPSQYHGSLVTVDQNNLGQPNGLPPGNSNYPFSNNPGGATQVGSGPLYYSITPGVGTNYLTGLDFDSQGNLYASTVDTDSDFFNTDPSKLLRVDPLTGNQIALSGTGTLNTNIVDGNGGSINVADLAFNPLNDALYGISEFGDLYSIDTTNAVASHIGLTGITFSELAGGLTFDANGNLFLVSQSLQQNTPSRLLTVNTLDASTIFSEDVLLAQQILFENNPLNITAPLDTLTVDENGVFYSSWGFGGTFILKRVLGEVTDANGNVIAGSQGYVWEVIGDTGEAISGLAFQPDLIAAPVPAALPLMITGLLGLFGVAKRKSH